MSVEIFVQRLRERLAVEKKANHADMDKGLPADQYVKLVGRNAMIAKTLTIITEEIKQMGAEDDGD